MAVIDALAREVGSVSKLLHWLGPEQRELPTRCPPLTVRELAAHMLRGGLRIQEMLDAGPVDAEPEKDGVTYFHYNAAAEAPRTGAAKPRPNARPAEVCTRPPMMPLAKYRIRNRARPKVCSTSRPKT